MNGINYLAVVIAAIAGFAVSTAWYILFGREMTELRDKNPAASVDVKNAPLWKKLVQLVRTLVLAYVLAHFLVLIGVVGWMGGVQLGIWVWIGFPVVILLDSVLWENVPWQLASIHAGDLLVKILVMSIIPNVWR
jgi:Protein of unknown function (DUF1761)